MPLAESSAEEKQTLLVAVDLNDNSSIELAQRFAGFTSDSLEVLFAPIDSSAKVPDGISLLSETVDTYAMQHPHVPVVSLVDCRAQNECAPVATLSLVQAFVKKGITNPWTLVGFGNRISSRALLGFKRVVENEQPQLDLRWAGLCDESDETLCAFLSWVAGEAVGCINMPFVAHETEIEVQNGQKFVPEVRVHRHAAANPENPIELAFDVPGKLDACTGSACRPNPWPMTKFASRFERRLLTSAM